MDKSFTQKVYKVVSKIPKGKTLTYKQVAKLAGSPRAFRAVGNIMNKNPYSNPNNRYGFYVPCHRVVKSDGTPGGYARGTKAKIAILKKEGAL